MTPYQTPNAALLAALRTWVDSKEALERTNGSPSITREEVELISRLIRMKDATEADPGNCIGDLNLYTQQQGGSVDYSTEEHIPPGRAGGGGQWRIYCRLSWSGQVFPQPGYGYNEGEKPPSFSSKKAAKQFAAKQAMEYIRNEASSRALASIMGASNASVHPHDGSGGSSSSPPPKRFRTEQLQPTGNLAVTSSESNITTGGLKLHPVVTNDDKTGNVIPGAKSTQNEAFNIQTMIRQLALRMNYHVPTYDIKPEPNRPGFFQGEATWRKELLAPEQPIRVQGVYGAAQATVQLAAKVYEWLEKQEARRVADLADIMEDIAPARSEKEGSE
ncbi:hypothetical protein NLU13_3065 [Sarocladium strictum]|uniref:DRBM domain-containing protein n=1 Tax=Sarocladium strictum TaxID=5046 RepID=A0AA39GLB2_SARSR|nr:hypothetical protein NLU13_3065 [Sarocladium strictum]